MPLVKPLLEAQILAAFQKMSNGETDLASAQINLARELATAIDVYIKTATVTVPTGQLVTGVSPAGPITGATTTPVVATIV